MSLKNKLNYNLSSNLEYVADISIERHTLLQFECPNKAAGAWIARADFKVF